MSAPDPTGLLLAQVRRYAVSLGIPDCAKLRVSIRVADTGEMVASLLANPKIQPVESETREFVPSATQKRILVALLDGPMKGEKLAEASGLANRSSLYGRRGLPQLIQAGLILNDDADGYCLTDPGRDAAAEIAEG
ncbi:MAG TPA: hypothetical protein VNT76_19745 [Candidatus Binatus sp.]|nr:hypothetical protein [Candidatus Binatus sp.]